jgi:hypothetical protein
MAANRARTPIADWELCLSLVFEPSFEINAL